MLTACHGADLTRWQDGQRSSGRLWQRVKRRDRSLGPASRGAAGSRSRQRSRRKPWRRSSQGSTGFKEFKERPASYQGEHRLTGAVRRGQARLR